MELWWDEFVTLGRSLPDIPRLLSGLLYQSPSPVSTDCSPPLHHLLEHAVLQLSHGDLAIRLPSIVFGIISLFFLMRLCQRIGGLRMAVAAGTFCAFSLFHLYYSRDIRWYSVYYGCSLFALYCLYQAITLDRVRDWAGFVCGSALSLYTSYIAVPFLAGESLFLAGLVAVRWRTGAKADAKRLLLRSAMSVALAFALYAPWLPGQYYAFYSFYGKGSSNAFELAQFFRSVRFFLEYFYQTDINTLFFSLPLIGLGYLWGLAGQRRRGVLLVLAWGVPPIAAAYWVKTEFSVSPKYIISTYYLLVFGLALGSDAVAGWLASRVPRGKALAGWSVALGLTLVAGMANWHLAEFYQGKTFSYKGVLRQIALEKNNIDFILYENERNFSFVGDWYLGDLFKRTSGVLERGYKRFYYLSYTDGKAVPWVRFWFKTEASSVSRGAIVNRSPLMMTADAAGTYRYADTFNNFQVLQDAWKTENATVDVGEGVLVPSDMSREGKVIYAFVAQNDQTLQAAKLRIAATCLKRNVFFPDAAVTVLAGRDPDHLVAIGVLNADSPPGPPRRDATYRGSYNVAGEWDIPPELLSEKGVFVALAVSYGTREGWLKTTDMTFEAVVRGKPAGPEEGVRHEWRSILTNLSEKERPRTGDFTTPGRLAAFSLDAGLLPPQETEGLGTREQRRQFLDRHPGLSPVYVLRAEDGREAAELYDPWLEHPYLTLAGQQSQTLDLAQAPVGYKTTGGDQTMLTANGKPLPLSCGLPNAATAVYAARGDSVIVASEPFEGEGFDPNDFYSLRDIRIRPESGELTCMGKTPCQATYRFESLYPMTRLVLTSFPHVFGDAAGENAVRVSYAEDSGPFRTIYALRSDRSGQWRGFGAHPHVDAVPLAKGTRSVRVRLEMANDGSVWKSPALSPMSFEVYLHTAGMPPMASGTTELVNSSPQGRAASVYFLNAPPSAFERLRPGLTVTPLWRPFFR